MNLSNYKPSVVIVSSSDTKPKILLQLITRSADIIEDGPHRLSQSWKIDTKYYTADIDIHGITEHYQRNDDFNETVKALIIHTDCKIESGLADLKKWEVVENECDPEIKLLVSDYCSDETKITFSEATEWCLKHGFEFIVLYPKVEIDQEENIIKEKIGVDRIIEALQAYVWPNLKMKEIDETDKNKQKALKSLSNEQVNSHITLEDTFNDEVDDFTELFGHLNMMKESIQSMPAAERKHYAEQMVTAFWRAIGGDEEELEDL